MTRPEAVPDSLSTSDGEGSCQIRLLVSEDERISSSPSSVEVSIVVPALNEVLTIGEFVDWCRQGLEESGVVGEILIVDSSTDRTAEIALAHGARVLKTPRRGLGRAYIDAIPFIRGKYVIMGDCDCTYDFRQLRAFVEAFRNGKEYIMGSRFRGSIEPGAMPPTHRYFGTPATTWILNRMYGSRFSDIHCGMRGITREALERMDIRSQGWEYASEMVLKSVHMNLKTAEVPIHFLKEPEGRTSHHRRIGWWSPWQAGWINLKAMFIYGSFFFLFRPGLLFLGCGLLLTVPLLGGPVRIGAVTFSLYWMLLGVLFNLLGLQCLYMSILSRVILDFSGGSTAKWTSRFSYDRSVATSVLMFVVGILLNLPLVMEYLILGMKLPKDIAAENFLAVFGLFLMVASFMNFTFTLLIHALALTRYPSRFRILDQRHG